MQVLLKSTVKNTFIFIHMSTCSAQIVLFHHLCLSMLIANMKQYFRKNSKSNKSQVQSIDTFPIINHQSNIELIFILFLYIQNNQIICFKSVTKLQPLIIHHRMFPMFLQTSDMEPQSSIYGTYQNVNHHNAKFECQINECQNLFMKQKLEKQLQGNK